MLRLSGFYNLSIQEKLTISGAMVNFEFERIKD